MMLLCPRCQRVNPAEASFCHFDGAELRPGLEKPGQTGRVRLPHEFVFPSGRRCRSFDELAQGCLAEWDASRDLLRQGAFGQFLAGIGRTDLAQAAQQANNQADPDLALDGFVTRLPATIEGGPQLDLHPRRLNLGKLPVGETRQVRLTILNQGKGLLHGTIAVAEGVVWLGVGYGQTNGECSIKTHSEQQIVLRIDTRGLSAPQKYSAKLTVITNGGIVEVPVGVDIVVQPFSRQPFQGVSSPRELAERMRAHPKQAVPFLESGEIAAWFAVNGWAYPVSGHKANGIAAVQQFFEGMGLSKPPTVKLVEENLQLFCEARERVLGQVTLRTEARKWVYAKADADVPWMRVITPTVSGPQQALISFEVSAGRLRPDKAYEGHIRVVANAGQELSLGVRLGVLPRQRRPSGRTAAGPLLVGTVAGMLFRLVVAVPADIYARALVGESGSLATWLSPPQDDPGFAKSLVVATFGLGALAGAVLVSRLGRRTIDILCGIIAGAVAGLAGGATLDALLPAMDLVPRFILKRVAWAVGTDLGGGAGVWTPIWIMLATLSWGIMGGALGGVLGLLGDKGGRLVTGASGLVAWFLRMLGFKRAATYFG
jgi:hypothetical protein